MQVATKLKSKTVAPSTIGLMEVGGKDDGKTPLNALDSKTDRNTVENTVRNSDARARQLAGLKPWQPGVSPNPGGRPKGAKTRLEADFMWALADSFRERGKEAVNEVIDKKPHEYLKIIAQLMPKEISVTTTMLDEMSLEQLEESLETLKRLSGPAQDVVDVKAKLPTDGDRT
jgi:hypothetical protein